MGNKWTKDQQNAISAREGTLLVSAAAGSGKTSVLVQRVIERITDQTHPCDADRLLVVTFTKAAAAEMKQRISLGNEKDILVLISKTGETKEVIRLAEIAKKKGIQVIAITNMTKNSLSTLSDLQLKILSSRVKTRLQAYASSVELIYVIDSLILLLYKADYAKYRGKVEKYIEVVREKQE